MAAVSIKQMMTSLHQPLLFSSQRTEAETKRRFAWLAAKIPVSHGGKYIALGGPPVLKSLNAHPTLGSIHRDKQWIHGPDFY